MLGHGLSCVPQSGVQRGAHLTDGNGAVNFLAIDEESRGSVHAQIVGFFHGRPHGIFLLRFDAGLQLRHVEVVFLPLQHRNLVDRLEARRGSLFRVHLALIGVDVVGEVPIGIGALRCQAVGVNGCVYRPGMNLGQRVIFVDERNPVAVFLDDLGKQGLRACASRRGIQNRRN